MMTRIFLVTVCLFLSSCTCQKNENATTPETQTEAPVVAPDGSANSTATKDVEREEFPIADHLAEEDMQKAIALEKVSKFDLNIGKGMPYEKNKQVTIDFEAWLTEKTKFDSTIDRQTPLTFLSGASRIIKGLEDGIAGMRIGGERIIVVPAKYGYGRAGIDGKVPPNSVLIYHVKLLAVK